MGPAFTMQTVSKPVIPKHWLTLPVAIRSDSVGRRQKHGQPRSITLISFSDGQTPAPHARASKPKWRTVRQGFLATVWGSWHLQTDRAKSTFTQLCAVCSPCSCWLLVKGSFLLPRPFHEGLRVWQQPSPERLLQQAATETKNEPGQKKAQYSLLT